MENEKHILVRGNASLKQLLYHKNMPESMSVFTIKKSEAKKFGSAQEADQYMKENKLDKYTIEKL